MRLVRLGLGSIGSTVGAVRSNTDRLLSQAREMETDGVTVACFPEQVLGGYPAEDLVQWGAFLAEQRAALDRIAAATADSGMVVALGLVAPADGRIFNVAAVLHRGEILGLVPKEKLPTYNVFYEARTLAGGFPGMALEGDRARLGDYIFGFDFGVLAVEVCEDGWSPDGPMRRRCYSGAELVINLSASPFRVGVAATRREMLATRSADNQATLAYVNAVGGQDALIFDGGGFVFQSGRPLLEALRFHEGWAACTVDLDRTARLRRENSTWRSDCEAYGREQRTVPMVRSAGTTSRDGLVYPAAAGGGFLPDGPPPRAPREESLDELFEALGIGVRDYYRKSGAFRGLAVALSGGRDSVLTLLVAWHAAHLIWMAEGSSEGVPLTALYMPTRFSTGPTRDAAETICRDLNIPLRVSPLEDAVERELTAVRALLDGEPGGMTGQNVQARLRALRMWNWCNATGALFLQTGDMSERAVGYTTIGGDLEGGLSVIGNLPKTVVVALLERLHARFGFEGISQCLATVPGPELAADQSAEQELMPFRVLDTCLQLYAGEKLSPAELGPALAAAFPDLPPARVADYAADFVARFTQSIYKWVQAPLTLHVGTLDLERERALQLPVVQRSEWGGPGE